MTIIYKIIYYLFIAAILVIALLLLSQILAIPGGVKTFIVQSGSMEPSIKTGSVIIIKPATEYKVGDIITFGPYSKTKPPTTHRIVEIKGNIYSTKGDANDMADTREISKRDILGKEFFTVPYVGYAVATAKKPVGFAVLIIIPALIIIFDEGKKIWKEVKKIKEKKNGS
jgi:signal peptidase